MSFELNPSQAELDLKLVLACQSRATDQAAEALAKGASPEALIPGKHADPLRNVLSRAIDKDAAEIVRLLVKYGAHVGESSAEKSAYFEGRCHAFNKPACLLALLESHGIQPQRRHMEWALEWNHSELIAFLSGCVFSSNPIAYDIDIILASGDETDVLSRLSARLPERSGRYACDLYAEEVIVRDVWDFCCSTGSGFGSLVLNQNFETIESARLAFAQLPFCNAAEALNELEDLFASFQFPFGPSERSKHMATLDDAFEAELSALDHKWFAGERAISLWHQDSYRKVTVNFIRANIEIFRKRKAR